MPNEKEYQMHKEDQYLKLYNIAKEASNNSYSPYSKYSVGAAVQTGDGKIFTGTNIENASYGLTICAERVAISKSVSDGKKDIVMIAIYSKSENLSPCGACRQFIIEFNPDMIVIYKKKNQLIYKPIKDLLPDYFSNTDIE